MCITLVPMLFSQISWHHQNLLKLFKLSFQSSHDTWKRMYRTGERNREGLCISLVIISLHLCLQHSLAMTSLQPFKTGGPSLLVCSVVYTEASGYEISFLSFYRGGNDLIVLNTSPQLPWSVLCNPGQKISQHCSTSLGRQLRLTHSTYIYSANISWTLYARSFFFFRCWR